MTNRSLIGAVLAASAALAFSITLWTHALAVADDAGSAGQGAQGANEPEGVKLMKQSDCFSCHLVDQKAVGPAYVEVAKRYANEPRPKIVPTLVEKVRKGGSGNWGDIAMRPHPKLTDEQITAMVNYVLSVKPATAATAETQGKTYTYKTDDGKEVTVDFPVFTTGKNVTADIFQGWEKFDSYCFRCHGEDAVGGEYAPDLRQSLNGGMSWNDFLSTSMAGRTDKGMPSWAGFFEQSDIRQIYEYVKARSTGVLPIGRPGTPGNPGGGANS